MKTCKTCGQKYGPTMYGARRENPAQFRKRKFCSVECKVIASRKLKLVVVSVEEILRSWEAK